MAYRINVEKLDEKGEELVKYQEANIKEKIDRLMTLINELNWKGPVRESFFKEYEEKVKEIYDLSNKMELLGYYLRYVAKSYEECKQESRAEFEKFVNEMQSNKKIVKEEGEIKNV